MLWSDACYGRKAVRTDERAWRCRDGGGEVGCDLKSSRGRLIEKGMSSKDVKEEKRFAFSGVKNFARRKSKCKGRDTRACQLVGGTGGRQTWLGRDLGWSELGQARNNPSLIFFEQEGWLKLSDRNNFQITNRAHIKFKCAVGGIKAQWPFLSVYKEQNVRKTEWNYRWAVSA